MDVVVTVPLSFGLDSWITEGDAAGDPDSGQLWAFSVGGSRPDLVPGDRVYVVCSGRLRGYAPLVRLDWDIRRRRGELIRGGGAVAVTVDFRIPGFRGWRYRWWPRDQERPFPDWRVP